MTIRPQQYPRSLNNEIVTRQMIDEINAEREKSDRLTVAKLNAVKQFNKQDYKSKLMTEKYSLLPLNSQQLTLPSLTRLAPLKSLVTLYINICKITFFLPLNMHIYMLSYLYVSCVKG